MTDLQIPPSMLELQRMLRQEREINGLTLKDVAEATGLTDATLSRFERGATMSYEMCRALIEWLLTGQGSTGRAAAAWREMKHKAPEPLVPPPTYTAPPAPVPEPQPIYKVQLFNLTWDGKDPETGIVYTEPLMSDGEGNYWDSEQKKLPVFIEQKLENARQQDRIWIEGLDTFDAKLRK